MIEFRPAIRTNTPAILALAGASGSGKTKTALELAVGLAGPSGKIAVIDSEGRRALHYADDYRFDHGEWRPPFEPNALLTALKNAEEAGYAVIIVDSTSDEYEGEGGLQDMAAADLVKQRGEGNSAAAWARPKAQHKLIIKWLRQCRCHVIFCLRAEEKVKFEKRYNDSKGREETVIVPIGWVPICEKRFMFDMTTSLLFTPDHPGVPIPIKLYEKHVSFFPGSRQVTREAGKLLAEWSAGGASESIAEPEMKIPPFELMQAGEAMAKKGTSTLEHWWLKELTTKERVALGAVRGNSGPNIARWKEIAATVNSEQTSASPPSEPPAVDAGSGEPGVPQAEPQNALGLSPLSDDEAFCDEMLTLARGYTIHAAFDNLKNELGKEGNPHGDVAARLPKPMYWSLISQIDEIEARL